MDSENKFLFAPRLCPLTQHRQCEVNVSVKHCVNVTFVCKMSIVLWYIVTANAMFPPRRDLCSEELQFVLRKWNPGLGRSEVTLALGAALLKRSGRASVTCAASLFCHPLF